MARPEILYLVHRAPYPPDKGDRIRTFHVLRLLSARAEVDLACLADEPVNDEVMAALKRYCRKVAVVHLGRFRWVRALGSFLRGRTITEGAFRSPRLRGILREWCAVNHYTAALASSSALAPYLRAKELAHVPAVIDLIDVDSQKWFDYAGAKRWPKSWLYRVEGRRLRKLEGNLPSWARAVTLVSEAEANMYRKFAHSGEIHSFTNGVNFDYFNGSEGGSEGDTEPATCIFVGALDYYPNIDAACWFCKEVWPSVRRRRPESKLQLVGRRPVTAVQALARHPGVEVIADVPDVRPYLRKATLAVAPLRIARGLQNKVLEALAMRKAVLASAHALAALNVRPGVELLTATSAAEWTDGILRLLGNAGLRSRLGDAGRAYVKKHHDWDACLEPLARLLNLATRPASEETRSVRAVRVAL